jgi:hypothetical protein
MANLFDPHYQAVDANGLPMAGAKLYFYLAGTSTLATVYQNADASTPHTNPVVADASGLFPPIYVGDISLKAVLKSALDVTVQTTDQIDAIPVGSISTAKIADSAVTTEKLDDGAVTTSKLENEAVTPAKTSFLITTAVTKTVGTSGADFTTLAAAFDWALARRIIGAGSLSISLLAGEHALATYKFDHPDASKISLVGQAIVGTVPRISNMTGTLATDVATIEAVFPSRIALSGASNYGLSLPKGLATINNIYIKSTARYSLMVGNFSSSYQNADGSGASIRFGNFAITGGIWGVGLSHAFATNAGAMCMAHQGTSGAGNQGGPFLILPGSTLESKGAPDSFRIDMYGTVNTGYGMFVEGAQVHAFNNLNFGGPMQLGIHAIANAVVDAAAAGFSGVQCGAFAMRNSYINLYEAGFTNCNASASDAPLEIAQGNSGPIRCLIGVGQGSSMAFYDAQFNGCLANLLLYAENANNIYGQSIDVTNCKWTQDCVGLYGFATAVLRIAVTSPQVGSLDTVRCDTGASAQVQGSTGLTYSPNAGISNMNSKGSYIIS